MNRLNAPKHFRWSEKKTYFVGLFLSLLTLAVQHYKGSLESIGFGEIANLFDVWHPTVPIIGAAILGLCWRIYSWFRPRSGRGAFQENEIFEIKTAFEVERRTIEDATIPCHSASARVVKSIDKLDFGSAARVISKESLKGLRQFIARPKSNTSNWPLQREDLEQEILVVTGEPGSGKSVLLQEIHAALSLGTAESYFSFVPLFIFARDLQLYTLKNEVDTGQSPMRAFLVGYYTNKCNSSDTNKKLDYILHLIANRWDEIDFLVIIDGLDEIPQRSAYEKIQRMLAEIILADLKIERRNVHRYILSCRVDEDLELFQGANTLFIEGLTDKQRIMYCDALVSSVSLDKQQKERLKELLSWPKLSPSHVFRRNPYFLSLLLNHITSHQTKVREQRTLNFDFLMRDYLHREAVRPFRTVDSQDCFQTEDRETLLRELEKVSRACLQYLAFRSALTEKPGALYDEIIVEENLIAGFIKLLTVKQGNQTSDLISSLRQFIEYISDAHPTQNVPVEAEKCGFTKYLHESDIRLIATLADKLRSGRNPDKELLFESLGTIPAKRLIENVGWYNDFIKEIFNILKPLNFTIPQSLAALLFIRSIIAAQTLRIMFVKLRNYLETLNSNYQLRLRKMVIR